MKAPGEIERALHDFVAVELLEGDAEGLTPETNLLALGVIDSLTMVSLRVFIERSFSVRLPDGLAPEDFTSVSAVASLVERLQGEGGAGPTTPP